MNYLNLKSFKQTTAQSVQNFKPREADRSRIVQWFLDHLVPGGRQKRRKRKLGTAQEV